MKLRPYQDKVVQKALDSLNTHNKALVVSPTGSGKTIMLSYIIDSLSVRNALVLVHRKEVNEQNLGTYQEIYPDKEVTALDAKYKDILMTGVTFCMIQSLISYVKTKAYYDRYQDFAPELIVVDESHRIMAKTYQDIINYYRKLRPSLKLLGMTATPERSDGQGLDKFFKGNKKEINLIPLIETGALVKPVIKVIDIYNKKSRDVKAIDNIAGYQANVIATNQSIAKHWIEENKDNPRKTIVFTKGVKQAKALTKVFNDLGIKSDYIIGKHSKKSREIILDNYRNGDIQVLFNVYAFREGFNHPETSCVMLTIHRSSKSPMIQMIGRALRPAPNKKNCLIIDFGISIKTHKDILPNDGMKDKDKNKVEREEVEDEEREDEVEKKALENYELVTLDILKGIEESNVWYKLPNIKKNNEEKSNKIKFIASGFNSMAYIEVNNANTNHNTNHDTNTCILLCGNKDRGWEVSPELSLTEAFIKGRDFIQLSEGLSFYMSHQSMIGDAVSTKQKYCLKKEVKQCPQNKYEAKCLIDMQYKEEKLERLLKKYTNNT